MGKLDDLKRTGMANAFESMGAFAPVPAAGGDADCINLET